MPHSQRKLRQLIDSMKSFQLKPVALMLLSLILLFCSQQFSSSGQATGQKRRTRPAARQRATKPVTNYSKFSHSTRQHQEACKSCHQAPTNNWQKAAQDYPSQDPFPDVADFPGHDSCVRCHRAQFFKGARPVICGVCHTKISPRDDARASFRNLKAPGEFRIEFPHDKHQDVIAALRRRPNSFDFTPRSLVKLAHPPDDKVSKYNNCEICHAAATKAAVAPATGWIDAYVPPTDTFKVSPETHASCFNCHWNKQAPTRNDCAGCHKLGAPELHTRISMKFRHDGGGEKKNHVGECATCHINITKAATLRGLKPDVPIFPSCATSSCHQKVLNEELNNYNKAPGAFKCTKCHTTDVGNKKPPNSHAMALLG